MPALDARVNRTTVYGPVCDSRFASPVRLVQAGTCARVLLLRMAGYLLMWLSHIPFICSVVHRGSGYFPLRVVNTAAMDIYILDTFQILILSCFSHV